MSRSGPESGGLVLRVDQKKWPGFKTEKQMKKSNDIKKKMSFECMLLSILQIQLFQALPKGGGACAPCHRLVCL
jgi:hypothetical protein